MYTGVCKNGAIPVLNAPKLDGLVCVTNGPVAAVVVYEYSSVAPSLV